MIMIDFKGIVKYDKVIDNWYAENKNGKIVNADLLTGIDDILESYDYDMLAENDEIEIIIKIKQNNKE